jgi:hypothetical protein
VLEVRRILLDHLSDLREQQAANLTRQRQVGMR